MHTRNITISVGGSFLVFALLFTSVPARGMNLQFYDLDSLVYLSSQIVEGQLGGEHWTNNVTAWRFKISAVHKGNLKARQSIDVTDLDSYRVSSNSSWDNDKFKEGDRLFLFLDRAKKDFVHHIPDDAEIYWPIPSGVRLVIGEKALRFGQYHNPGPYLAILQREATNTANPTVAKLREQILESIPRTDRWKLLLERQTASADIPALLEILRDRESCVGWEDAIASKACVHIAASRDIAALTKALNIRTSYQDILANGFRTSAGREFLFSKIDSAAPIADRLKWIRVLNDARPDSSQGNFTHIARLIANPHQDPKVQNALLGLFQTYGRWSNGKDQAFERDFQEAELLLKKFLDTYGSEELKYEAHLALVRPHVNSNSTLIVSIVRQADKHDVSASKLTLKLDVNLFHAGNWNTRVALVNSATGQKLTVKSTKQFTCPANGWTHHHELTDEIAIPKDLPNGRYRVFYEFLQHEKVVSASHFFEANL